MSNQEQVHGEKIYVTLDCLLDTRMGTLAKMGSDLAVRALRSNYKTREIDAFPGVDRKTFREAYTKRDVETLKASLATNVFLLLQACVKGSLEDLAIGGQNNGIVFVVNYHPYKLEPEEVEAMREMIYIRAGSVMDVEMISVDDLFLTPRYCKESFAMMIRYDYVEWYHMHLEAIQKTPMPGVAVLVPGLYYDEVPQGAILEELKRDHIHPFRTTEVTSAVVMGLKLLNVDIFCLDSDIKPRKP